MSTGTDSGETLPERAKYASAEETKAEVHPGTPSNSNTPSSATEAMMTAVPSSCKPSAVLANSAPQTTRTAAADTIPAR